MEIDDREASIKRIEEKHSLYKRVFESADGQEILADLERDCYLSTTTYSKDALDMAYKEGMRCVVLHIKTMIGLDSEKIRDGLEKGQD